MSQKNILIVEDEEIIRNAMRVLLESEGFLVDCAENGYEGMRVLRQNDPLPGLILLDLNMPVRDGYWFRKEQEQDIRMSLVPVVIMTASRNIDEKAKQVGASGFLKKPFDLDHIVNTVQRYFS